MSYPKKITREAVLACALDFVEKRGLAELSMRTLAAELGVTPNALYRYVASKDDLAFAMADEVGRQMLEGLRAATEGKPPPLAVHDAALAYLRFALRHPEWYAVKMQHCRSEEGEPPSHTAIWRFVMDLSAMLPTRWEAEDLALSLWAFLHGMVELARAGQLAERSPEAALSAGLEVMLAGLMTGVQAPQAPLAPQVPQLPGTPP